jgi:hypothetical protein
MTAISLSSSISQFSKEQLEAIEKILKLLDSEEFRDYHDQFGVCNAPDIVDALRREVKRTLSRVYSNT